MRIPAEFQLLVTCFYQGSDKEFSSLEDWAAMALRLSEQERSPIVKQFLDELLSGRYSDAELQRVWWDCGPDYEFADDALRTILTLLRDAIQPG